ncbi:MAG TPA: hypothetical protein VFT23_00730 [Burkholderiales bacterium]|nr:hypothetical protein [Burkholderiales bacterium]
MPVEIVAWLALALAAPALALACLAIIKARMLEFCPEVLAGDVILPRTAGDRVRLLLPPQFTNASHADGVVEWIAIRLRWTNGRSSRYCCPRLPRWTWSTSSRRSASSSAKIR